ncbi:hypothetical protein KC363_g526 [Hortaea werneckii]|nr:hypothetical protein KC363_g526 [Hortaea werneckii]
MAQPRQNAMYSVNPGPYQFVQQNHQQPQHQGMLRTQAMLEQQPQGQQYTTAAAGNILPPQSVSQPRYIPSSPAQSSSSSQAPIRFSQTFGPVQLQRLVSRDGRQRFLVFLPITAAGHRRLIQMAASQEVEPTIFISNNLRFFQGASDGNTGRLLEQNGADRQCQQQPQSLSGAHVQPSYPGYPNGYDTVPAVNSSNAVYQYQQDLASHQYPPTQRAAGTPYWDEVAVPQPASMPLPSNSSPNTPVSPSLASTSVGSGATPSPEGPLEKIYIDLTTSDDVTPPSHPATPVRRPAATKAIPGSMRWQAQNAARKLSSGLGKNEYATPKSGQTEEQKAREAAKVAAVAAYEKVKADSLKRTQRDGGEQGLSSDTNHSQTIAASIIAEAALPTPRNDSVSSDSQGSKDQEAQLGSILHSSARPFAGSLDVLPDEVRKMQGGESVKQTFHGLDKAGLALNLPWLPGTMTCIRKLQRDGRVEICLTGDLDVAQVRMDKLMGLPKAKRAAPSAGNVETTDGEPAFRKQIDGETVASQGHDGKKYRQKKPQGPLEQPHRGTDLIESGRVGGTDQGEINGDLEEQLRAAFASDDSSPEETGDAMRPELFRGVAGPASRTPAPQGSAQQADEASPDGVPHSAEFSSPQGETPSRGTFTCSPEAMASVAEQKSGAYGESAAGSGLNDSGLAMGGDTDQWQTTNTQGEAARSSSIPIDFDTPLADDDDLFGEGDLTVNSAISSDAGYDGMPISAGQGGGIDKRKRSAEDVGGLAEPPHKRHSVKRSLALPPMRAAM